MVIAFTARQSATTGFWSLPSSACRQIPVSGLLRSECRRLPNHAVIRQPCQTFHERRSASTFSRGQPYRNGSTERNGLWTTGRVSLLVAITGVFTYLYGVQQPWLHKKVGMFFPQSLAKPKYGSKKEMEKVCVTTPATETQKSIRGPQLV